MGRRWQMIGGAIVTGLLILVSLTVLALRYNEQQDLAAHGVTTQATVTDLRVGKYQKGGPKWQLFYTFTVSVHDSPIPVSQSVALTQEAYAELRVGQTVPVRYLPTHPTVNQLAMPGVEDNTQQLGFILLLLVGMTVYFVRETRQPRKRG